MAVGRNALQIINAKITDIIYSGYYYGVEQGCKEFGMSSGLELDLINE